MLKILQKNNLISLVYIELLNIWRFIILSVKYAQKVVNFSNIFNKYIEPYLDYTDKISGRYRAIATINTSLLS